MKPTDKQIATLQQYLKKTFKYKESREEVLDHIICALAHHPGNSSFEDAVNNIIRNDFGGHDNLEKVEKGIKEAVSADTYKRFRIYLTDLLRLPALLYLAGLAIAIYAFYCMVNLPPLVLKASVLVVVFVPSLIALFRFFYMGYITGDKSRSVRDVLFGSMAWEPMVVFGLITVSIPMAFNHINEIWSGHYPSLTTLCMMAALVYNIGIIKLYKSEVKLMKEAN